MTQGPHSTANRWIPTVALALALTSGIPAAGAGEVYKWVDEYGDVHFGDRPADSEGLSILPSESSGAPTARPENSNLSAILEEDRLKRKAQKEHKKQERADRERNCHLARDHLREITTVNVVYDLDQSGKRVVLSREQRMFAEARARQEVATWCEN